MRAFGSKGTLPGQLLRPHGVAVSRGVRAAAARTAPPPPCPVGGAREERDGSCSPPCPSQPMPPVCPMGRAHKRCPPPPPLPILAAGFCVGVRRPPRAGAHAGGPPAAGAATSAVGWPVRPLRTRAHSLRRRLRQAHGARARRAWRDGGDERIEGLSRGHPCRHTYVCMASVVVWCAADPMAGSALCVVWCVDILCNLHVATCASSRSGRR